MPSSNVWTDKCIVTKQLVKTTVMNVEKKIIKDAVKVEEEIIEDTAEAEKEILINTVKAEKEIVRVISTMWYFKSKLE